MAQMLAGRTFKGQDLPIFTSSLPTHPFAPFRRIGQRMLYRWYHLRDEAS
jgi:taurine dehydrogenase large subunit